MATSSYTPIVAFLLNNKNSHNHKNFNDDVQFSFPRRSDFHNFSMTSPSKKVRDLIARKATPEVDGDLVSSFPIPGIPSWFPTDNPWLAGAAGVLVGVPVLIQRLVALTRQLDMAAQMVKNIADTVEKVAENVEHAAEELEDSLPEGHLKEVVHFVEHLAKNTADEAKKIGDLMEKVEEIEDKLKACLDKLFKHTD